MRIRTALPAPPRLLSLVLLVVIVDEVTKTAARLLLPLCLTHGCPSVTVFGSVKLVRVGNAGSALGFAQGLSIWTFITAAGLVGAGVLARRSRDPLVVLGAILLVGGGVSNLGDRLVVGAVTDFISTGPIVFNLADVALAVGAVLMSLGLQRQMQRGRTSVGTPGF